MRSSDLNSTQTLLGLGDSQHPLSVRILKHFAREKAAVNIRNHEWTSRHSKPIPDASMPDTKIKHICSDVCLCKTTPRTKASVNKLQSFMKDIVRAMKPQTQSQKKQFDASARHPVFMVRCGDSCNSSSIMAWIITTATFKPLTFDAIRLVNPDLCQPHCQFQLGEQSNGLWDFASLDRVALDIAVFQSEHPQEHLQYCYTSSYKMYFHSKLSVLHFDSSFNWIQLIADEPDEDDDDDDDQQDAPDDEMNDDFADIADMVSQLTNKSSGGMQPSKSETKQTGHSAYWFDYTCFFWECVFWNIFGMNITPSSYHS